MTRVADVDAGWVAERRRAGVSWSHIAKMAGVAEPALRARFAPNVGSMAESGQSLSSLTPFDRVKAALRGVGVGETSATILARMWVANGAMRLAPALTRGLNAGIEPWRAAQEARNAGHKRLGLIYQSRRTDGYGLMPESIVKLSQLAGVSS